MSSQSYNRIFLFWTGDNAMSRQRRRCLDSFYVNSSCDVVLVTSHNLSRWLVSALHPAYPYLSFTHRADYLRCYFMHHYGGGYSDIKNCSFNWAPYFRQLRLSGTNCYMCGYRESSPKDVASLCKHIRSNYRSLPGMGHFIFKPYTPITFDWFSGVHSFLDGLLGDLISHPGTYHPRAVLGGVHGRDFLPKIRHCSSRYPLRWNDLLGQILHPISFKYQENLSLSMPYVDTIIGYR